MRKTILAITTLIGTIIGAGILGIPYVIMKSGFIIGLIHIFIIAFLITLTMLYLGEIVLRTKHSFQLTGYAEKYLGKKGKMVMMFALGFGIYSAFLAYLFGAGESLSFLFYNTPDYSLYFGIALWLLISTTSYFGIKALESGEFIGVSAVFLLIISMFIFFINKISLSNFSLDNVQTPLNYFLPFGVILFAFLGYSAIPEVKRILGPKKNQMKRSIILAILICSLIYILFAAIVIGYKGQETPEIATFALGKPFILFGILTMSGAYLALSIALIDTFHFDFNQTKIKSWFFAVTIPLILFILFQFLHTASFTKILGIGGVISGTLTAILILLMAYNSKFLGDRKPEYSLPVSKTLIWFLSVIFIIGTIAEIARIFT